MHRTTPRGEYLPVVLEAAARKAARGDLFRLRVGGQITQCETELARAPRRVLEEGLVERADGDQDECLRLVELGAEEIARQDGALGGGILPRYGSPSRRARSISF